MYTCFFQTKLVIHIYYMYLCIYRYVQGYARDQSFFVKNFIKTSSCFPLAPINLDASPCLCHLFLCHHLSLYLFLHLCPCQVCPFLYLGLKALQVEEKTCSLMFSVCPVPHFMERSVETSGLLKTTIPTEMPENQKASKRHESLRLHIILCQSPRAFAFSLVTLSVLAVISALGLESSLVQEFS